MNIMKFIIKHKYAFIFKTFAIIAILFFLNIHEENFAVCDSVEGIACIGNMTIAEGTTVIPFDEQCKSADQGECCRYIYDDNPQCYMYSLRQSVYAGFTGGALMLFAEVFYVIALLLYSAFPFLTKYVVYGGSYMSGPGEAAKVTASVFAKAIYFITPILLVLILLAIYKNLPLFI